MKLFDLFFFFAALPGLCLAATLYGTVYDSNLDPLDKSIASINTTPEQTQIALQGRYSFEVPPGEYSLQATYSFNGSEYASSDYVVVAGEGNYSIDLIIFSFEPVFNETEFQELGKLGKSNESLGPFEGLEEAPSEGAGVELLWVLLAAAVLLAGLAYYLFARKLGSEKPPKKAAVKPPAGKPGEPAKGIEKQEVVLSEQQRELLRVLKENEGRMTQKELRRALPYSEAKVSMDLTELEHYGLIKRFKRGRGKIVRLA